MCVTVNTLDEWSKRSADEQAWNSKVFLPKTKALTYLQHKRSVYNTAAYGNGVGIVCECCTYKCSITEMAQYCKGNVDYSIFGKRSWDMGKVLPPGTTTWKSAGMSNAAHNDPTQITANNPEVPPLQPSKEDNEHAQGTGNDDTSGQQTAEEASEVQLPHEDMDKKITELILLKMFPEKKA